MRVLVAEDDAVSRRLLKAQLTKWGYEVVVARDGTEAWDILESQDSSMLAIVDWMMPGVDGLEICRRARSRSQDPYFYIVLLTAKSRKEDIVRGMEAGADDYLTKPFDADELNARVRAGKRILDLQAELIRTRENLRVQAAHDPLTGLPNRLLFSDRLTQMLAQAERENDLLAVAYLDLDGFKLINDTLGHNVGDLLLKDASERLSSCLRASDTLARMGGDEFTILLPHMSCSEDAVVVCRKILESLSEPFVLNGRDLSISASVGITMYPSDGSDVETLVKNADTAMYRSKEQGKNTCQLYTETLNIAAVERMALQESVRTGLERNEFLVYYQPRVDIRSGRILGVEALVRWQHPKLGLVLPDHFIPMAEETGLILPVGEHVLRAACAQNKAWHDQGFGPTVAAVNISGRQFQQGDLVATVTDVLNETGLDPRYLELELTESILTHTPGRTLESVRDLEAAGVRITIDDFGTGYSSLSYLKRFPVTAVKIDRSFVNDVTTNPDSAAIASAAIAMAHSLRLQVIAEGVETLQQLEFLRGLQCDEVQGYFISPPAPADEIALLLKKTLRTPAADGELAA